MWSRSCLIISGLRTWPGTDVVGGSSRLVARLLVRHQFTHGAGEALSQRLVRNSAEDCRRQEQLLGEAGLLCRHGIAVARTTSWLSIFPVQTFPNVSVSSTPTPKEGKYLALKDGSKRMPKRAGHGNENADGLLRSPADSGTSGGRPASALGTIGGTHSS